MRTKYHRYVKKILITVRDIKPENFLLKNKDDISNIKLIDFGLSKDFSEAEIMQTPSGSPYYIAPEVFQQKYDNKCDMWSMGVVLYIMLSGKVPFPGECNKEIIENVMKGEYHYQHDSFKNVSEEAKDLISKLLLKDPVKRLSAEDAYNHPWIQKSEVDTQIVGAEVIDNMNVFVNSMKLKKTTLTYLATPSTKADSR